MKYLFTDTKIALMIVDTENGQTHSIPVNEEFRYEGAKKAIELKDFNELTKILYPDQFFISKNLSIKNNDLYFNETKLPNKFSLKLIKNQDTFKGFYNYWLTSQNQSIQNFENDIIDLIDKDGYCITDDGYYFIYNAPIFTKNNNFYSYSQVLGLLKELLDNKINLNDILIKFFGNYSKHLSNEFLKHFFVENKLDDTFIYISYLFNNIIHTENIIKMFPKKDKFKIFHQISIERFMEISEFVQKHFNNKEKKLINLINKENSINSLIQCVNEYKNLKDKINIDIEHLSFSSFDDLYRIFLKESFKLRNPLIPIDVPKNFPAFIHNKKALTFDNYQIVYPTSNYDLDEWSFKMSNCIRGYTEKASSPNYLILALIQDDKMLINMELSKYNNTWRIVQFRKYGNNQQENSTLAKQTFEHIMKEIIHWKMYKKIKPSKYLILNK